MTSSLVDRMLSIDSYGPVINKWFTSAGHLKFIKAFPRELIDSPNWNADSTFDPRNIEQVLNLATLASRLDIGLPYPGGERVNAFWVAESLIWWTLETIEAAMPVELPKQYRDFSSRLTETRHICVRNIRFKGRTSLTKG